MTEQRFGSGNKEPFWQKVGARVGMVVLAGLALTPPVVLWQFTAERTDTTSPGDIVSSTARHIGDALTQIEAQMVVRNTYREHERARREFVSSAVASNQQILDTQPAEESQAYHRILGE